MPSVGSAEPHELRSHDPRRSRRRVRGATRSRDPPATRRAHRHPVWTAAPPAACWPATHRLSTGVRTVRWRRPPARRRATDLARYRSRRDQRSRLGIHHRGDFDTEREHCVTEEDLALVRGRIAKAQPSARHVSHRRARGRGHGEFVGRRHLAPARGLARLDLRLGVTAQHDEEILHRGRALVSA